MATKVKTSELTGAALDWAVELAKGTYWSPNGYFVFNNPDGTTRTFERNPEWRYSTDWAQGGPIIERERIWVCAGTSKPDWFAEMGMTSGSGRERGPTPLIAAMRCYVASKMGDTVEIPEELS